MIDRAVVSQEVTVMVSKNKRVPKIGEVLKVEVIKMSGGSVIVTRQEVSYVAKDGKSFGIIMRLLKHDGTWSTHEDFANTNYAHKVTK